MFDNFANYPAEYTVLECLIFGNIDEYSDYKPECFDKPEHKEIYVACTILRSQFAKIELATLFPHLSNDARLVLTNMQLDYINNDSYEPCKEQVLDFYLRREIFEFSEKLKKDSFDFAVSSESLLASCREFNKGESTTKSGAYVPDLIMDFYEKLEKRSEIGGNPGISFGYKELDKMTGGLIGGYLYVIAGRPAMGKSAFASSICVNVAKNKKNVAYFSLEMSKDLCMQRFASYYLQIPNSSLKTGELSVAEWEYLAGTGLTKLGSLPIYIFDSSLATGDSITDECLKLQGKLESGKGKLDLIVVDYLQIMTGSYKDRRQIVEDNCRKLKILAKRLNVPVIMLSQLNRENVSQGDKRPQLNQLRETGAIEQDADTVMFIHRPSYYAQENNVSDNDAEIIIAKQRDGALGTVHLHFDFEHTAFRDLAFIPEKHVKSQYEQSAF